MIAATPLELIRDVPTADAGDDLEASLRLLREVAAGRRKPFLRIYAPSPTLAFGQRDTRLAGFERAQQASRAAGFEPVVRSAGGRAAAYHRGCLIVDHVEADPAGMVGHQARFAHFGELFAAALLSLGVDAGVGEIPGEYCPGEFSVHATEPAGVHQIKVVGTAQRVISGAWLFSSVVVVSDAAPLRAVTQDVYAALGLPLDPGTVGAAEDMVAPGARPLTTGTVADALIATWQANGYPLSRRPGELSDWP